LLLSSLLRGKLGHKRLTPDAGAARIIHARRDDLVLGIDMRDTAPTNRELTPKSLVSAWFIIITLMSMFFYDLQHRLPFLIGIVYLILVIPGVVIAVLQAINVITKQDRLREAFKLLLTLAVITLMTTGKALDLGAQLRFHILSPYYELIVRQVLTASTIKEKEARCAGKCRLNIEDGMVRQVFFPIGMVGEYYGWEAVVYDVIGEMAEMNTEGKFKDFFDCGVIEARHLRGSWYFCILSHD
jgi:hypothetical protein